MAVDLLKRRNEVLEGNRKAESTPGSGWHLRDQGAEMRDGEPKLSERPVSLQHNDRVHVVGPDVAVVKAAWQKFLTKLEGARKKAKDNGWDEPDLLGHGLKYQEGAVRSARKALAQGDVVELLTQEWNYANSVLGYLGVLVSSAVAEVQSYDDV